MELYNYSENESWKSHHQMAAFYDIEAAKVQQEIMKLEQEKQEYQRRAEVHRRIADIQVEYLNEQ